MPFFENAGDYVPDLSVQQIHLYQSLLRQKAEITRQIQSLIESVPKVQRPKWHCFRCDHTWNGYFPRKKPRFCASCKSMYWDREKVKSPDAVRSRRASREEALEPIAFPKSLAAAGGLTPPPVFTEPDDRLKAMADVTKRSFGAGEVSDSELKSIAGALAAANKIPVRNRFAEDIVTDASGGLPLTGGQPETATVQESDALPAQAQRGPASGPAPGAVAVASPTEDEGPHCCSKPTIIDGFCVNCGDGLEVPHGHE